MSNTLTIAGVPIHRGQRMRIDVPVARLFDFTEMHIPVEVIRGRKKGPTLFICGAIHGDEINGVEIAKRVLKHRSMAALSGTLIAVPIVNVFGFNTKSRYLPDRRDLNRCFPGSEDGSLAAQLAYQFMQEVVLKADYGIDLHTGAIHRSNLPQIRAAIDDQATHELAKAFGVPVIINSSLRDGSLREAAREHGIPMLLYEGGEALRFNESVIRTGVEGVLSVMHKIGMLARAPYKSDRKPTKKNVYHIARSSYWVRAPHSGTVIPRRKLGQLVKKGEVLGTVSDPFGEHRFDAIATQTGIIIGMSVLPLVNDGDALFHIATFEDSKAAYQAMLKETDIQGQMDTYVL